MGRKGKSKIVFDKELVTKENAEKLVAQHQITEQVHENEKQTLETANSKHESDENLKKNGLSHSDSKPKKKKKRKQKAEEEVTKAKKQKADDTTETDEPHDENSTTEKPEVKREDSIRAKKRKKHEALMQEKKLKAELALQQKCLNYLSQWKHNRGEWKFEKLKQVWLQQNMLSAERVPEKMWDTLVEYFAGCKGKAREAIIKDALKVVEAEDEVEEENQQENEAEDDGVKVKRARDIIQSLQE